MLTAFVTNMSPWLALLEERFRYWRWCQEAFETSGNMLQSPFRFIIIYLADAKICMSSAGDPSCQYSNLETSDGSIRFQCLVDRYCSSLVGSTRQACSSLGSRIYLPRGRHLNLIPAPVSVLRFIAVDSGASFPALDWILSRQRLVLCLKTRKNDQVCLHVECRVSTYYPLPGFLQFL